MFVCVVLESVLQRGKSGDRCLSASFWCLFFRGGRVVIGVCLRHFGYILMWNR